jgi:hypothetical protein
MKTTSERISALLPGSQNNAADTNMLNLLEVLPSSEIVPDPDKYYVFVYKAKSKGITYDSNPFVHVDQVFRWGFTGTNLHLGQPRRYTWGETASNLYEVDEADVQLVLQLPTTNIHTT